MGTLQRYTYVPDVHNSGVYLQLYRQSGYMMISPAFVGAVLRIGGKRQQAPWTAGPPNSHLGPQSEEQGSRLTDRHNSTDIAISDGSNDQSP
jgi:hypothetical protein